MTRDEFNDFVARDHDRLMGMARYVAGTRDGAEDLLHTAVMRICEREAWAKCPDPASMRGYLVTTMKRTVYDQHARSQKRPEYLTDSSEALEWLSGGCDPRGWQAGPELRDVLVPAVEALPERWRMVVAHRLILDRSIADTATALGIPSTSVASAMKRAIGRLKDTVAV